MLSEKIYTLRRRNGLSQEQLVEKLGVSRQAVSKWEGGLSTPELDKLMALSQCFGVSLDELTGNQSAPPPTKTQEGPPPNPRSKPGSRAGVLLCAIGGACLALLGLLSLLLPPMAEQVSQSSTVTLNGTGIFMALFLGMMAAGAVMIFRKR